MSNESLCCAAEIDTALYINNTSLKKINLKEKTVKEIRFSVSSAALWGPEVLISPGLTFLLANGHPRSPTQLEEMEADYVCRVCS